MYATDLSIIHSKVNLPGANAVKDLNCEFHMIKKLRKGSISDRVFMGDSHVYGLLVSFALQARHLTGKTTFHPSAPHFHGAINFKYISNIFNKILMLQLCSEYAN